MKIKDRLTTPRIIIFLLLAFFVFLPTVLFFIIDGIILNVSCFLTFICLPLIILAILSLIIFSKKRNWLKILLTVAVVFAFVAVFFEALFFTHFETLYRYHNEEISSVYGQTDTAYEEIVAEQMPLLSEIGTPESMEYCKYFSSRGIIFTCDSYVLICRYDEKDYEEQKQALTETYVFQTDMIRLSDGKRSEPTAELNDYQFRMLSIEEKEFFYPSQMVLIAFNDETQEIVYISFYDDDLDRIDSLASFIQNECGWKHICG